MPSNQQQALYECECSCGGCPCCPGWPQSISASILWSAEADANAINCGAGSVGPVADLFGCDGRLDETGVLLEIAGQELWVRVWCDADLTWHVQYRSNFSTGVHIEPPAADAWADATGVDFVCPDCANAVGGVAIGTIDFIALQSCEYSGPGYDYYGVLVHADVEISCI